MFGRAGGARLVAGVRVVLGGSVSSRVEGKGLVARKGLQSLLGFFWGVGGGEGCVFQAVVGRPRCCLEA